MIKNLYINKELQKILVKVDGSSSSAILLYIICDYFKDTDTKIIPYCWVPEEKGYTVSYIKDTINTVSELTNKKLNKQYIFFPASKRYTEDEKMMSVLIAEDIDIFYTALHNEISNYKLKFWILKNYKKLNLDAETAFFQAEKRNQPFKDKIKAKSTKIKDRLFKFNLMLHKLNKKINYIGFLLKFPKARHKNKQDLRSPYDVCLSYYPKITNKPNPMYTNKPFADRNLIYVSKLYKKYNLVDTLLPVTFDCGDVKDYKVDDTVHHCGYCVDCMERWYAFKRLK